MHNSMEATGCTIMTENEDSVWCEVRLTGNDKFLVGRVYRSPSCGEATDAKINRTLQKANSSRYSHVLVCGDLNHPRLNWRDGTSPPRRNAPSFTLHGSRKRLVPHAAPNRTNTLQGKRHAKHTGSDFHE